MSRLLALGGLANKLRAILSYRAVYGTIDVVWLADEYVSHAHFLDVFEPIHGVEFVAGGWQKEDFAPHPDRPAGWEASYRFLVPKPQVQQRIDELREELKDYVAVHIRRTDHVPNMNSLGLETTPDEAFRRFVAHWPSHAVFVATDNGETQRRWTEASTCTGAAPGCNSSGHRLVAEAHMGALDHHAAERDLEEVHHLSRRRLLCATNRAHDPP